MDRYIRNIQLPGFGVEGQERLRMASVMVVGAGALGSVSSMYLTAAGIGRIGISDFDVVDMTNLTRQLSYGEANVGQPKVVALSERLRSINSEVEVELYPRLLEGDDLAGVISNYDVIVEASDNPATKCAVTDAAQRLGKPYVIGGVEQYRGLVMSWRPGHCGYREFFPEPAADGEYVRCAEGGVFGPVPGMVASTQAAEVIKIIAGVGKPLFDRLLMIDALTMTMRCVGMSNA